MMVPQSGAAAGAPCGGVLQPDGSHVGRCRAGAGAVKLHHGLRTALARAMKASGLTVVEEEAVPSLAVVDARGQTQDAIMDVVVRAPWSAVPQLLDLTIVESGAARYARDELPMSALAAAHARKLRRYGPSVATLAWTSAGKLGPRSLQTLASLADLASEGAGGQPSRILRGWLRATQLARAAATCGT